jgi:hypothetical protein
MEWQRASTGNLYSLLAGGCRATIQRASDGTWRAMVEGRRTALQFANFTTLAEAQAWYLAQLAQLRASGACSKEMHG